MELQIRPIARSSVLTHAPFQPGDRVASVLYRDDSGEVERADVLVTEEKDLQVEGEVLCRWSQTIKARSDEEAEARKQAMQTAEEVFLSLYGLDAEGQPLETGTETEDEPAACAAEPETDTREQAVLRFLLALMLERKRVLRSSGRTPGKYRHVRLKRELDVPQVDVTPETLVTMQAQLEMLG